MDAVSGEGRGIDLRMRNGWRGAGGVGVLVLFVGMIAGAGPRISPRPAKGEETAIRLTLDVSWGDPALPVLPGAAKADAPALDLEVVEGRILDAQAEGEGTDTPRSRPDGTYRLGEGPSGRARVRIETTIGSVLLTRVGGTTTRFPVAALLEGPLHTLATNPVPITIERISWDALEIRLGPEGVSDGIFAPGALIPAALGFNVILPEPAEVAVRYSAELRPVRGGEPAWTFPTHREVVATNATRPPGVLFSIPAPRLEGSYVLEVRATWEPVGGWEGSRLARLLKRTRNPFPVTVVRRVSLAVMGAKASPPAPTARTETVADSLDLTRARGYRAMASGRAPAMGSSWAIPEAAVVEAARRDRLRGWNLRGGPEPTQLAPADATGLAWSALVLRVPHPGRPHRLTVKVAEGQPADLGVALVAPGGADGKPRLLLDAAASGPAVAEGAAAAAVSWPVWPDAEETVLVLVNRSDRAAVKLASVELRELPADPPPAILAETHPGSPRSLALQLSGPGALDRFGGTVAGGPPDVWSLANALTGYAVHCGASTLVLADDLSDRARRAALEGQAAEDATGPDRLDLILRVLARRNLTALLEIRFDGTLPGLPPHDSPEALARGLVRVDRGGKADGPAFQPLQAEVFAAMKAKAVAAIGPRGKHPNLTGLIVRLGPGATLPGGSEVGLDDFTYARFVKTAFQPDQIAKIPGIGNANPNRFAARWQFVTGPGREGWLEWRAAQVGLVYAEMARAIQAASPGAILAVTTPGLDDGPAGAEARRADRAGLAPLQAWRAVGLDLDRWPIEPGGPIVLRGVGVSTDDLSHDLATSPDLDASVASRPGRGLWLGANEGSPGLAGSLRLAARPIADGPAGEELFGHALAVLDARWIVISGTAAAGQEERLARFARVFRALPAPAESGPPTPRLDSGVAVRTWVADGKTYVAMANDTPYQILMENVLHAPVDATVDDLGRRQTLEPKAAPGGGKALVLKLPPFGVAAVRVSSASAKVEPISPYLPSGRDLDAQYERLSARLGRLAQAGPSTGPANSGFEETGRPRAIAVAEIRTVRSPGPPATATRPHGWVAEGDAGNAVEIDPTKPRSGLAALRLDARALPASVASSPFLPPGRTTLSLRAWLRADLPETPVRVWIEGDASGKPFSRHADAAAGTEWAEIRLQVVELPPGGLDRIRLRIERKTPGPLWLDDVAVSGDGPSESVRRAHLVLTGAQQAYREKRYADFARLAGSHWAREVEPDLEAQSPERPPSPIRTGSTATDLPSGRRLR
ncbi:MAG: hypothetical protein JWN86_3894 [Planctomycetota bacterium]|nr:hypothetical protein [Planctomycetota bacterium]